MDSINIAKEIILKDLSNVIAIYVFGSYASGFETEKSDLDLAILLEEKIDKVKLWNLSQKIAAKTHLEIDLIDLREANTIFAFQIITESKIIHTSDNKKRIFFENKIDSMYLDLNEMRKGIIEDIKKRKGVY
ncbi:MAG: hypothetical protein K1060chlam1_00717 [Candidatus Anoxychlamydiales bacterium]|nr:hypothetical protein [Candidatus Anoxychlamydiales bacterium]